MPGHVAFQPMNSVPALVADLASRSCPDRRRVFQPVYFQHVSAEALFRRKLGGAVIAGDTNVNILLLVNFLVDFEAG